MLSHHYPFIPFGRLVMKRHHYPLIPCAPCTGKSRFDLVYIPTVHFNCKYLTSLYFIYARAFRMPPRNFASRQNPSGGKYQTFALKYKLTNNTFLAIFEKGKWRVNFVFAVKITPHPCFNLLYSLNIYVLCSESWGCAYPSI